MLLTGELLCLTDAVNHLLTWSSAIAPIRRAKGSFAAIYSYDLLLVGAGGIEPPISWFQTRCHSR